MLEAATFTKLSNFLLFKIRLYKEVVKRNDTGRFVGTVITF